ncbi:MAG: glycosyltransferase [Butyrivibrio sp.]|nr:glycosyltransferase [Butyrivibrio sp.]
MSKLHDLNDKHPILSISLLTAGQKDTLQRCLDSLTHLRTVISSELIIVDTGCDSEMRSIIDKYTDKIYTYTWTKDFSSARNFQLSKCSGQWFLFLDDDEWFEDTREIESFFQNGTYKSYDFCNYIQRNYHDNTSLRYSDDYVTRMAHISDILHFESCIHEYMVSDSVRTYSLNSYVHHYGYVYNSDAQKYSHFERNITLLNKMLLKEPDNMRWYIHIVQEYWAIAEYSKLIDFSTNALNHFKKCNTPGLESSIATLYMSVIEAYFNTFNYNAAIESAGKALKDSRLQPLAIASLNEVITRSYAMLSDYDSLSPYALTYLKLYEQYNGNIEILSTQSGFLLDETFTRQYFEEVCWILVQKALYDNDLLLLKTYFDKIDFESDILFTFNQDTFEDIVRFMAISKYDEWFVSVANRLISRAEHTHKIIDLIKDYEKKAENATCLEFTNLLRIFSQADLYHPYIAYLKILSFQESFDNKEMPSPLSKQELLSLLEFICINTDDFLLYKKEFWHKLLLNDIDVASCLKNINFDKWKAIVETYCNCYSK